MENTKLRASQKYKKRSTFDSIWRQLRKNKGAIVGMILLVVIGIVMLGVFDIVGPVADEDKKEIHVRTYQQVFPYAELLVKQLCAAGGMPNFMLLRHKMDPEQVALNKKQ